jgi:hypothetical protein
MMPDILRRNTPYPQSRRRYENQFNPSDGKSISRRNCGEIYLRPPLATRYDEAILSRGVDL